MLNQRERTNLIYAVSSSTSAGFNTLSQLLSLYNADFFLFCSLLKSSRWELDVAFFCLQIVSLSTSLAQPLSPLGLCLVFMVFELCSLAGFCFPPFHCVMSIWSLLFGFGILAIKQK